MEKEVIKMGAPKIVDERGRLLLGKELANTPFLIEKRENGDIVLRKAMTVPASEAWLIANEKAFTQVAHGLENAKAGQFVPSPVNPDDDKWISQIDDEE